MPLTIHYNLHARCEMGRYGRFLKQNILPYAENPEVYQTADVVQQKTQLPDQRQLRKLSSSQFQLTCPKASASPVPPDDTDMKVCHACFFLELTTVDVPLPSKGQDLQKWRNVTEDTVLRFFPQL